MRDLKADLEICNQATPGPVKWQKFGKQFYLTGQYGLRPIILGTVPVEREGYFTETHISNRNADRDILIPLDPAHPDSKFIEMAWEGWPEAINRAIAAEEFIEKYKLGICFEELKMLRESIRACNNCEAKVNNHYRDKAAALREENDLQRASIQKLSCQVAGLREGLEKIKNGCGCDDNGCFVQPWEIAANLLSSPDPGAEIRERMAKLEAVAKAAKDICKECREEAKSEGWDIVCEEGRSCEYQFVRIAFEALDGDRP